MDNENQVEIKNTKINKARVCNQQIYAVSGVCIFVRAEGFWNFQGLKKSP